MITAKLPFLRKLGLFILFIILAFLIFWKGRVEYPRAEQYYLMGERTFAANDWDYFVRLLSNSRTQVLAKGNLELWRPLPLAVLGLEDIFFRQNLFIIGASSILIHALIAFALFLALEQLLPFWVAFFLSLNFLTSYMGMENILWRHINPFSLNILFLAISFFLLLKSDVPLNKNKAVILVILLLLAGLSAETTTIPLVLYGGLLVIAKLRKKSISISEKDSLSNERLLMGICFLPAAIYWFLNGANWIYYVGLKLHPDAIMASSAPLNLAGIANSFISLFGLFALGFLIPQMFDLSAIIRFGTERIESTGENSILLSQAPLVVTIISGVLLAIILLGGTIWIIRKKGLNNKRAFLFSICSLNLFFLVLSLSLFRVRIQGRSYIDWATNYFYNANFYLLVICSILFLELKERKQLKFNAKLAQFIFILVVSVQICSNYLGIQRVTSPNSSLSIEIAKVVLKIDSTLEKLPDVCYADGINYAAISSVPKLLLQRRSCLLHPLRPIYSHYSKEKKLSLVALSHTKEKVRFIIDAKNSRWSLEKIGDEDKWQGTGFLWAQQSPKQLYAFESTVHRAQNGAIVFAHKANGDYFQFGIEWGKLLLRRRLNGKNMSLAIDFLVPSVEKVKLGFLAVSDTISYLYVNDQMVKVLFNYGDLSGGIGIFDGSSEYNKTQYFTQSLVDIPYDSEDFKQLKLIETINLN